MTSLGIKLKATLPKHRDENGLSALRLQLLQDPRAEHLAIVVFDVARIIDDVDDLFQTPVIRILRLEPETDADRAVQLLARAKELSEARNPQQKPMLDPHEASGLLRHGTGLRLAGGGDRA